jgi:hypothetical protein
LPTAPRLGFSLAHPARVFPSLGRVSLPLHPARLGFAPVTSLGYPRGVARFPPRSGAVVFPRPAPAPPLPGLSGCVAPLRGACGSPLPLILLETTQTFFNFLFWSPALPPLPGFPLARARSLPLSHAPARVCPGISHPARCKGKAPAPAGRGLLGLSRLLSGQPPGKIKTFRFSVPFFGKLWKKMEKRKSFPQFSHRICLNYFHKILDKTRKMWYNEV